MLFEELDVKGVFLIKPEVIADQRGFFARTFCRHEFKAHGLDPDVAQCNLSFNHKKGTVRGMHYQTPPHAEVKVVSCTRGRIYDVALDLRDASPTYCKWVAYELSAEDRSMLYIPKGVAHGFQTLKDETELSYQMSEFYDPAAAAGVRWDDPAFGIVWPLTISMISSRDRSFNLWRGSDPGRR